MAPNEILIVNSSRTEDTLHPALCRIEGPCVLVVYSSNSDFTAKDSNYSLDFARQAKQDIQSLIHSFRVMRKLSEAEIRAITEINLVSTLEGIEACRMFHGEHARASRPKPKICASFVRRLSCWRAGRWKSLT